MAAMTMLGNWTGPHRSSVNQPPPSTGVRPVGSHRDSSPPPSPRPSSPPPPPATGRRPAPPVVDIQICLALSGRPASLEGLTPELDDVRGASGLGSAATVAAPLHSEPPSESGAWAHNCSVVPLARPRAVQRAAAPAPESAPRAVPVAQAAAAAPAPAAPRPDVVPPLAAARAHSSAGAVPRVAPPSAPAPTRRKGVLFGAVAVLTGLLLAGAAQLQVPTQIHAAGAVHSAAAVDTIRAPQPSTLVQLLVQPGETVAADQAVAQLATAALEAELAVRWDAFLEQQAELLASDGGEAPALPLAHAVDTLLAARDALVAATVRAPRGGRVESLAAQPGSVVSAGQPLLLVAPSGAPRSIIAFLPAAERAFVQPGAAAAVELPVASLPAPVIARALVTQIAPDVSAAEELPATAALPTPRAFVRVQLELQGAAPEVLDQLRPGEPVSVRLSGREQPVLSVVLDSVRTLLS